ncbi:YopX family protein [Lysinibacillus sp.]|uniref:YopX family protein n=1 Tax=Lysinibacillus sp. TaxID=1869345 RepID=UPI00289986C1|nr:YopX family protein [Lysinibacillus sp.]
MSREIKFRAWDGMEWSYSSAVDYVEDENTWRIFDQLNEEWLYCLQPYQYTGLMDKNGKEIYEGDIVQFKSIRDIIERYEVEYTNYGEWAIGMHRLSMRFKSCEVIGNIYENPELLEVTA